MNPILQMLNQGAGAYAGNNQIQNMVNMVKNAGNPNAMMQMLAQQNPQVKNVMNLVQQSGGTPKDAFYNLAKTRGVDPNQIINMLK